MSALRLTVCGMGSSSMSRRKTEREEETKTHPDDVLPRRLIRVDDVDGLLDLADDHVHVAIVGVQDASQLAVAAKLDEDPFGEGDTDEVEGLRDGRGGHGGGGLKV
jgi:hypothetical protein